MTPEAPSASIQRNRSPRRLGLFKRLGRSNRLFPRKLKINREGKYLVFITLGIGFAAINTGNNLMYLILGMLLSMIMVSGILSELSLRGIRVTRLYTHSISAQSESLMRVKVKNEKRFFVSYSIEVEEVLDYEGVQQVSSYSLRLGPGEEAEAMIRMHFDRRGVYQSAGLAIATRFPFSFFRKSRHVVESVELVVYPPVRQVPELRIVSRQEGTDETRPRIGRGGDVYGVREYREGDATRDIHWKTSARRRRWMVREFEQPAIRTVWVAFANIPSEDRDAFEEGITHVASLSARLIQQGCRVGVITLDGVVPADAGPRHRDRILGHLARLKDAEETELVSFEFPRDRVAPERVLVRGSSQNIQVANTFDQVVMAGEGDSGI